MAYLANATGFPALAAGIYFVILECCRLNVHVTICPRGEGKKFGWMNVWVLNPERLGRVSRTPLLPDRKKRWLRDSVILGWGDAYSLPTFNYILTFAL